MAILGWDLNLHLKMNGVNCMEARKDHWLIGTTGGGIVSTSDFRAFRTLYTIDSDLTSNSVLDMKTDAAGNIWVGLEGGVDVLKYNWPHRTPIGLEKLQEPGYSSLHLANGKRFWGTSRGVYSQENEDEPLEIVMGNFRSYLVTFRTKRGCLGVQSFRCGRHPKWTIP